jgi:hypothetical protein
MMADPPYRAPVPIPPDPYLRAWSDLGRRRACLAACVVALGAAAFLHSKQMIGLGTPVMMVGLVTVALSIYCESFHCPHCSEQFCRKGIFHNAFARRCLHCRIKVGTPKEG